MFFFCPFCINNSWKTQFMEFIQKSPNSFAYTLIMRINSCLNEIISKYEASLLEMREKTKKTQPPEKEFKITAEFLYICEMPQNIDCEKEAGRSLKFCFKNPSVNITLCVFNLFLIPNELGNYFV